MNPVEEIHVDSDSDAELVMDDTGAETEESDEDDSEINIDNLQWRTGTHLTYSFSQ